jgi:hypothetical protein
MPVKGGLKSAPVKLSVAGSGTESEMPPRFDVDNLSYGEREQIRRFIEEGGELSDEMHALLEKYWPWLLQDVPPRVTH